VVTNFQRRYRNDLRITPTIEAYRQSRVLKTTLGAISFEKRRGILDGYIRDGEIYKAVERLGIATMGTTKAEVRRKITGKANLHQINARRQNAAKWATPST
jgi:hypothetical protein